MLGRGDEGDSDEKDSVSEMKYGTPIPGLDVHDITENDSAKFGDAETY